MDVLFVVPVKELSIYQECEGTLLLATILKQKGLDVSLYRFCEADMNGGFETFVDESVNNIIAKNPKIISFYCRCDCFMANIRIAEKIRKQQPHIPIVFGGPQADASCREVLRELPWVDYCCCGEGEETVYPLFSSILKGESPDFVDGLAYRDDEGNIIVNKRPVLSMSLDELPFTDYSFVNPKSIFESADGKKTFPMEVGRGCPFNCAYCSTCLFWKRRFRIKSPKRIVAEMVRIHNEYERKRFYFNHDLFTANKKNVLEFCKELKKSGLEVNWSCSSRIDTIDEEMIDAMVEAGMNGIYFGVETGSPRMQKIINKNLDLQRVVNTCRILCDKNVMVTTSFMYGFPEETEEDIDFTLRLVYELKEMGVKEIQFHLCAILPGTEYYEKYRDQLVFGRTFSNIVGNFGVAENYDFICEHKDLFPFYYEYHNETREKFANLSIYGLVCLALYKHLITLEKEKYENLSLINFYLDFMNVNGKLNGNVSKEDAVRIKPLVIKYIASVGCSDENLAKYQEIFSFIEDTNIIGETKGDVMEVKSYGVNIKDFVDKKPLAEIKTIPSMVIFRKQGKKVSWVIK